VFLRDSFLSKHAELAAAPEPHLVNRQGMVDFMAAPARIWGIDAMAHCGVEMRDPTADRELMETLLSLPPEMFLMGGRSRGLVREMGLGFVPDSIRLRRRRGAQTPETSSLIARHAPAYRDALDRVATSAECREFLRLDVLRDAVEHLASGVIDNEAAAGIDRALDVGTFLLESAL
jgi:asparagine synthetase B (glutamine-hydrolysing)